VLRRKSFKFTCSEFNINSSLSLLTQSVLIFYLILINPDTHWYGNSLFDRRLPMLRYLNLCFVNIYIFCLSILRLIIDKFVVFAVFYRFHLIFLLALSNTFKLPAAEKNRLLLCVAQLTDEDDFLWLWCSWIVKIVDTCC
jgi:hypothetical protein